jgi:hypothetical protein
MTPAAPSRWRLPGSSTSQVLRQEHFPGRDSGTPVAMSNPSSEFAGPLGARVFLKEHISTLQLAPKPSNRAHSTRQNARNVPAGT